jgi:hypothetical protein
MNTSSNQTNPEGSQELSGPFTRIPRRKFLTTFGAVAGGAVIGGDAFAQSPVKLKNWGGTIDFSPEGISPFTLHGTASHLGRFTGYGEVEFEPSAVAGTLVGDGVVVFEAANGDLLVGVLIWDADAEEAECRAGQIHFSWRDSVEFSDGTIVSSTGRFADNRPSGLVVIAIIAILIGLLKPAVETVR